MRSVRLWMFLAGLNGAVAVGMAAYGAHALADADGYIVSVMDKATRYQGWHALALLAVAGLQAAGLRSRFLCAAGAFMAVGIVLFSGALYGIALAGWPVAFITPFGGTSFILGWLCLSVASFRFRTEKMTTVQ